uniref:Uncharacterized protein n=1 Tax=Panagrolaimus superbus TaxID=310955 RepID=A0A914Z0B3_9BILA
MVFKYLLFLLYFIVNGVIGIENTELRDRLQKNAKRPPWPEGNVKPLDVKIGIYVESLGKFQSTEMSFDVDLYLYMSWKDYTLNHTNNDYVLVNDPKVREHIWLPDLYFANARTAFFHDVTVPNFNLFIAQDGTIAYSSRVTLTVACNLLLSHYPMDFQICKIKILSYAYIANQINVTWFQQSPMRYNPEIGLPEFMIMNIDHSYCDGTYMYAIMDGSHKIALIVVISWVSFWIDRRAVPARVTLSFTTLLSLSTLGNGLRFGLPMVSYAKSIDYWFGMCMIFVFCALLEFAVVNSYMRKANKYEKLSKALEKRQISLESDPDDEDDDGPYIPSNIHKHSYHLVGNVPIKKKEDKKISSTNSSIPLSTFSVYRKKIALSRSSSSLNNHTSQDPESHPCSVYATTVNDSFPGRIATLATMDMEDSMTLSAENIPLNTNKSQPARLQSGNFRPTDESPTKTTFISDEEWPEQLPVFKPPPPMKMRGVGRRYNRGHRENKTMGVNHFVQLGFINSRKALRIDKLSRILFPLNFTIFNIFYWSYYLWYIPATTIQ